MTSSKNRPPLFERLKKSLEEIILHAEGKVKLKTYVVSIPDPAPALSKADVLALREELRVSETIFARLLNVPLGTVRLWEAGKRKPSGAAARLLQVFAARPEIVDFITHSANGQAAQPRNRRKTAQAKR